MKFCKSAIALGLTLGMLSGYGAAVADPASGGAQTTATAMVTEVNLKDGIDVCFSDAGITASSQDGVKTDGTVLTISKAGTYLLSGTCADGSVKIKKETTGVTLVLNGLNLTARNTAPIVCGKSTEVTIFAAEGTENTLADTADNSTEAGNTEGENAVIKCKDGARVTLCGTGTLNITANGKNGIKSGASTQEEGESYLTIRELTLNLNAANDAVNAEAALKVESGNLTISAGDDALHCDNLLNIGMENTQGPNITISACSEGLEGATVNVCSGNVNITSTDDCINAANSDLSGYAYSLNISGGTVIAYTSAGDGFDSNGSMTISGGTVAVWTANGADNSPLDADGTVTISGGTVLAAGASSGMGMNLDARQPCVIFTGSTETNSGNRQMGQRWGFGMNAAFLAEGGAFTISDGQGTSLLSNAARCGTAYLLFSSPELAEGDTCTLASDEGTVTALVQTGTVSTGFGGFGGFGRPGGNRTEGGWPDGAQFPNGGPPDGAQFPGGSFPDGMQPPDGGQPPEGMNFARKPDKNQT